jgi:hypothetical protein
LAARSVGAVSGEPGDGYAQGCEVLRLYVGERPELEPRDADIASMSNLLRAFVM